MKQIILILFAFIVLGCNQDHQKNDLLGTWDFVSTIDLETGEVELPEGDDKQFVEIRSDSLYLSWDDVYPWQIKGDSILIDDLPSVYIKELTSNTLTVEYDFLGVQRLTLRKRK